MDPQELKRTTLVTVPPDEVFHVCRGDRVNNIRDLANCVESLTEEQFRIHVSREGRRNDFAVWVFDVLKNPALSHDLNFDVNLEDKAHFVKTIRDHVRWLESFS
jgi:hypothetical protein